MKHYNFTIGPTDTDSISFCKPTMETFNTQELAILLKEINDLSPDLIEWENDGYYEVCIALKAKNYILWDGKKKTIKGSAFKTSSKEIALSEFMQRIVDTIIANKEDQLVNVYEEYVQEILNIKDINRWSSKKTVTEAVLKCAGYEKYTKEQLKEKGIRANETSVWDAIKKEELIQSGEKIYVYPAILDKTIETTTKVLKSGKEKVTQKEIINYGLKQPKYWDGKDQDKEHLLKRLYDTVCIFESVLDISQFKNYSLVKNYKELINAQSKTL